MVPEQSTSFLGWNSNTWIRLRGLILLRWIGVFGQIVATLFSSFVLGLDLPLTLCAIVISIPILLNLILLVLPPASHLLRTWEAHSLLLFDLVQLAALVALTGGLTNPFALLVIVPVTIAATILTQRSTIILGAFTVLFVLLIGAFHLPLVTYDGEVLSIHKTLEIGHGIAITIGAAFLSIYALRLSQEIRNMNDAVLATQMALDREQKLTDLGGVVAAAAHELGTPLATIKLVSTELIDELSEHPELSHLLEDAELMGSQADRCRDILRSMGRAGKDDLHLHHAPFETLIHDAAEPHMDRGKQVIFDISPGIGGQDKQPQVRRAAEIIHGLRNLIQNAVDFAESTVWIDAQWSDELLTIRVIDDGPGYPVNLLGKIGDPFLRARSEEQRDRPGYEGMGLGLFIAKTLLERSGAKVTFANAGKYQQKTSQRPTRSGAIVEVSWPVAQITTQNTGALGENQRFAT